MLLFLTILIFFNNAFGFDEYYKGIYRELHVYEKNYLCRLFRSNTEVYLQHEDISFEWTQPERILKYDKSCPNEGELCFKAKNYSFVFVSLSCNRLGHVLNTPLGNYQFFMDYDKVRFDHATLELYFLLKPKLYIFELDNFIDILKTNYLTHNAIDFQDTVVMNISMLPFDSIIDLNFTSNWVDFTVSDGHLLFTENDKLFQLEDNGWKSEPLSRVYSYYIPVIRPSTVKGNSNIHVIFYLLEFIVIVLLVYLCRIKIRKTHSAIYISPPHEGPYVEKPLLMEQKV